MGNVQHEPSLARRSDAETEARPKNTSVKNKPPARFWNPARVSGEERYCECKRKGSVLSLKYGCTVLGDVWTNSHQLR